MFHTLQTRWWLAGDIGCRSGICEDFYWRSHCTQCRCAESVSVFGIMLSLSLDWFIAFVMSFVTVKFVTCANRQTHTQTNAQNQSSFLPCDTMLAWCMLSLCVCLSVHLSPTDIVPKRLNVVYVSVFFCTRSQKPMQLGSPDLTYKCSTMSPGKLETIYFGVKGQGDELQKTVSGMGRCTLMYYILPSHSLLKMTVIFT